MCVSVLGIDTSNYTTSLSVCVDGVITENVKLPLTVKTGEVGIRQNDAVFLHTVNLSKAFEILKCDLKSISAVGYSDRPRNAEGSYMPCFLCGQSTASIIANTLKIPVYKNSHQQGHIKAAVYSSGMPEYDRFYAYHLSGGTLELLSVKNDGTSYECEIVGKTLDVTAGQMIDRVGVMLGLAFPCGKALEELARQNTEKLPKFSVSVNGTNCNLSGLQNKAENMIKSGAASSYTAAYVFEFIKLTIDKMTENLYKNEKLPLLFSGGVSSNGYLKEFFKNKYGAYFAEPVYSADNAAGTALLTYKRFING